MHKRLYKFPAHLFPAFDSKGHVHKFEWINQLTGVVFGAIGHVYIAFQWLISGIMTTAQQP